MTATTGMKAGAALSFLTAVGLIIAGVVAPSNNGGHVTINLPDGGGCWPGSVIVKSTARGSPQALALFGVAWVDGGPSSQAYFRVFIATDELDAGEGSSHLFNGADVVYDDSDVLPCDGGPYLEAWQDGRADAPFECACAPIDGGACMVYTPPALPYVLDGGWGPGAVGVTFAAGQWATDGGCLPMPCTEIEGSSALPPACGGS